MFVDIPVSRVQLRRVLSRFYNSNGIVRQPEELDAVTDIGMQYGIYALNDAVVANYGKVSVRSRGEGQCLP